MKNFVILLILGLAGWYFFIRKKTAATETTADTWTLANAVVSSSFIGNAPSAATVMPGSPSASASGSSSSSDTSSSADTSSSSDSSGSSGGFVLGGKLRVPIEPFSFWGKNSRSAFVGNN